MDIVLFFAQGKAAAPGGAGFLVQFIPFILIFVLFWFLIIRPQRKREREHQQLLNSLKKGDKVITSSGIFGEIFAVTPNAVIVEIAPKVKVTLQRGSIAGFADPTQAASESKAAGESKAEPSKSSSAPKKKRK